MTRLPRDPVQRLADGQRRMTPGTGGGTAQGSAPVRRYSARTTSAAPPASGAVPTLLVASAEATPRVKSAADAVCDGTDDQDQVNDAFAHLPPDGGRVVLSEGPFRTSGPISPTGDWQRLEGVGPGTFVEPHAAGFTRLYDAAGWSHVQLAHLTLLRSSSPMHGLDQTEVVHCDDGWQVVVDQVHMHGGGITLVDCVASRIVDCELMPRAVETGVSYRGVSLRGVRSASSCRYNAVQGGIIEETGAQAVWLGQAKACTVQGVMVRRASMANFGAIDAILLSAGSEDCSVLSCHVEGELFPRYGLHEASTCARTSILGNRLEGSGATADMNAPNGTGSKSAANHADGVIK